MSIRLSPKHGVNPCVPLCFFCGKSKNEIAWLGRLRDDAEAPRSAIINREPCERCTRVMAQGVIFLEVCDGDVGDDPRRTGKMVGLRTSFVRDWLPIDDETKTQILKAGFTYVPQEAWEKLGFNQIEEK